MTRRAPRARLLLLVSTLLFVGVGPGKPAASAPAESSGDDVLPGPPSISAQALGEGRPRPDFNGDGTADLAVGVALENVGSVADAGAVNVLYGSPAGPVADGDQYWNQNSSGVGESADTDDRLGTAAAGGDFDGDGFDDLLIGVPGENTGGRAHSGAAHVLYGTASGLGTARSQVWSQNAGTVDGSADLLDQFGAAVAAGDFDGDGFDDAAIGVPGETIGSTKQQGGMNVLYGSSSGLASDRNQFWMQGSDGLAGSGEAFDRFGTALATGHFDGDGFDDLVAGVPEEDLSGGVDAGGAHVLYGSEAGLSGARDVLWTQDSANIADAAEPGDVLGSSLAVGDFDGDGFDDLSAGSLGEDVGSASDAGAVNVIHGSASGLAAAGNQFWHQNSPGVAGASDGFDFFGMATTAGDFDGDGFDDLAVGVPRENQSSFTDAGAVNVLYGSPAGLASARNQFWTQNTSGIVGAWDAYDLFGWALLATDLGNGAQDDLAIGVVLENASGRLDVGAVNVIFGSKAGLAAAGNQLWHQDSQGVNDPAETGDEFGYSLAGGPQG